MKILFFQWYSFMNDGIERALKELGQEYDTFVYQFSDWENDEVFEQKFEDILKSNCYERVISVNFSPLISNICELKNIMYISWVYDSPLHIRDLEPLRNSCNRIYFFDRAQADIYASQGINAYHLPLAVDVDIFARAIEKKQNRRVIEKRDISFVGQLYRTDYHYYTGSLDEHTRGYLEGLIQSQLRIYGAYILPELITEELLLGINRQYDKLTTGKLQIEARELEYMLACEITGRERYMALAILSRHFNVDWYAKDSDERLKDIIFKGYADYATELPHIFNNSKINLNISLKTIKTGIPLRVIEIMGSSGLVMTNYQEELYDRMVPGEELVIYENLEDMYAKCAYYLSHEEERSRIAIAGYERVKRDFNFKDRIDVILRCR